MTRTASSNLRSRVQAFFWAAVLCSCSEEAARRPNVLLIVVDTLRADHLSVYGYPRDTSPALAEFARDGVVFDHALSQFQETRPSHVSLMTGLYPTAHGLSSNDAGPCPKSLVTWAEIMKANGYATGAVVGNALLQRDFQLDQGFDDYDDRMTSHELIREHFGEKKADEALPPALEWIERHRNGPFFFWLHLQDPHGPYTPPEPFKSRFQGDGKLVTGKILEQKQIPLYQRIPGDLAHDSYVARYDGEIAYVDDAIARLLAALRGWKLVENTLIILCADHGEGMGERGYYYLHHTPYVYQEILHVPLLFAGPGVARGARCSSVVELVDVLPTVTEMLGLPAEEQWKQFQQGDSFAKLLRDPGARPSEVGDLQRFAFACGREGLSVVRSDRWKLMRHASGARLFDLSADEGEIHDVIQEQRAVATELDHVLQRRQEIDGRLLQSLGPRETWSEDALASQKMLLDALGYVDDPKKK